MLAIVMLLEYKCSKCCYEVMLILFDLTLVQIYDHNKTLMMK
jgi:hypothetical protein